MPAVLFGSISTLADTSELQREAFNEAFADQGLDWHWDRDRYRELLARNGGQGRIAEYADSVGQAVDAAAVHHAKSEIFQRMLASSELRPRPGVADTIRDAKARGLGVALVTTTSRANITALLDGLGAELPPGAFDVVIDATDVETPKPDPAAYLLAVARLGASASDCVAVEDNVGGAEAARSAGVTCLAFPNENTAGHDFGPTTRVERVTVDHLEPAAPGR